MAQSSFDQSHIASKEYVIGESTALSGILLNVFIFIMC